MEVTLEQLAQIGACELKGDPQFVVKGVAQIQYATKEEISFVAQPKYVSYIEKCQAGALVVAKDTKLPDSIHGLYSDNPSKSFQLIMDFLYQGMTQRGHTGFEGIHPLAVVHKTATLGKGVCIGPHSVIDTDCVIGDDTCIGAGTYLAKEVTVGDKCLIYANVTLRERVKLGNRVIIQPGAVIGSCGFGFLARADQSIEKLSQLGNVEIEDDVEIGANTTIDRARLGRTLIKRGSKIDNLVQIGHGVEIGEDNLIVAQTGFAGSSKTNKQVTIAGQCGINGHIEIGSSIVLGAKTGVVKSLHTPGAYAGFPAMPAFKFRRQQVILEKIEEKMKRLSDLEKEVQELKSQLESFKRC